MTTTKDAVAAVAQSIGFDPPRVSAVARRMTEAGLLPSGAPRTPPMLEVEHVLALVIGCALDAPLRAVPDAVTTYRALVPHGADLSGAPASIPRTAGDALAVWADIAIHGDADTVRRDRIQVASSFKEIAIHTAHGIARFVPAGANAAAWQSGGHRRAVSIRGAALVDCLTSLFAKEAA